MNTHTLNIVNDEIPDTISKHDIIFDGEAPSSPSLPASKTKLIKTKSFDEIKEEINHIHLSPNPVRRSSSPLSSSPSMSPSVSPSMSVSGYSSSTSWSPVSIGSPTSRSSSISASFATLSRNSFRSMFSNIKTKMNKNDKKMKRPKLFQSQSFDEYNYKPSDYHSHDNEYKSTNSNTSKSYWRPTLQFIYKDKQLLDNLIIYMTKRYNQENILFLCDVMALNNNINDLLLSYHATSEMNSIEIRKINLQISSIYNTYIKHHAEKQINLSYECYNNIMFVFREFNRGKYSLNKKKEIFNLCVYEIEMLIQTSVLAGFYATEMFQSIAKNRNIFTNHSNIDKINGKKYNILSTKGYNKGYNECEIKILKCNNQRQEFGIVSNKNIQINSNGICETPSFGSRVVYGTYDNSFYYASYNHDNTVRCNKNLNHLNIHQNKWQKGDIIKICVNLNKGNVKFYLNGKQVRKSISIETNTMYYPIVVFSGDCKYRLI